MSDLIARLEAMKQEFEALVWRPSEEVITDYIEQCRAADPLAICIDWSSPTIWIIFGIFGALFLLGMILSWFAV